MQNPNIVISRGGHNHGKKRLLPVLMLNRGVECRRSEDLGSCQERGEFATVLCEWELLAKKGDYRAQPVARSWSWGGLDPLFEDIDQMIQS